MPQSTNRTLSVTTLATSSACGSARWSSACAFSRAVADGTARGSAGMMRRKLSDTAGRPGQHRLESRDEQVEPALELDVRVTFNQIRQMARQVGELFGRECFG